MRKYEVQQTYLGIQENLGKLIAEASPKDQQTLQNISLLLLRVKRNMIGAFDEVDTENIPL